MLRRVGYNKENMDEEESVIQISERNDEQNPRMLNTDELFKPNNNSFSEFQTPS